MSKYNTAEKIGLGVVTLAIVIAVVVLILLLLQWAWNISMPHIFNLPEITYQQAGALFVLTAILQGIRIKK